MLKDAVNGQWDTTFTTTTRMKQLSVGQDRIYGLLSNDSLALYDVASKTFRDAGAPRTIKYVGAGATGVLYFVETDKRIACNNISDNNAWNKNTLSTVNTHTNYLGVECGEIHCWSYTSRFTQDKPLRSFIGFPREASCVKDINFVEGGVTFIEDGHELKVSTLDTNIAGKTWMVEYSTGDIFFRYGVSPSSMAGERWINVPGMKLLDIAVGKDTVYGVTNDNEFVYFSKYNIL